MKKFLLWSMLCGGILFGFGACNDGDDIEPDINPEAKGVFILNEGGFGGNNAGISFYEPSTGAFNTDIMRQSLGDIGQDMLIYGSKLYVTVYASNYISVIDLATKEEERKINISEGGVAASGPRFLASHNGKVYASAHSDHLLRIDTASWVVAKIEVGPDPEGIAVVGESLYVAITNGLEYNPETMTNYLEVIDLASFTKTDNRITVNRNPYYLQADGADNLYVSSMDIYGGINYDELLNPGLLQKVTVSSSTVETVAETPVNRFVISDGKCYFQNYTATGVIDLNTKTTNSYITDETSLPGFSYGIGVDPGTKDIYVATTDYMTPGKIYVFGADGKLKTTKSAGINPNCFAFYY